MAERIREASGGEKQMERERDGATFILPATGGREDSH